MPRDKGVCQSKYITTGGVLTTAGKEAWLYGWAMKGKAAKAGRAKFSGSSTYGNATLAVAWSGSGANATGAPGEVWLDKALAFTGAICATLHNASYMIIYYDEQV